MLCSFNGESIWRCCRLRGFIGTVGQVNQLNDDLKKLQKELQSCQNNIKTLNKKLSYDM